MPKKRKPEITINLFAAEDGSINLVVGDNGVGLPPHVDFQNPETMGLQLVNMLTKQIRGAITLDTGKGTRYTLKFAVRKAGGVAS